MSSLLYYSISSNYTEDEIIKIDKQVSHNREAVYFFVKNLPSNSKDKAKQISCSIIKVPKKIIKKAKWLVVSVEVGVCLTNGVVPSQAIGLPILPQTPAIMRYIHSNADLSKQAIIAQVVQQMPAEIDFTQKEMNELYHFSVECKNNSLSQEELIAKITNLRGGSFVDVAAGLAIIAAIIMLANNANGFQLNPPAPHLQWLYGNNNNNQPGQFGYSSSPTTYLEMEKPDSMPQQEYSPMAKSDKRKLPDPRGRDRVINVEGKPRLDLRYNQVQYKTEDHGDAHGLPVGMNKKTPKTDANILAFRDSLVDMPDRKNIIWYTDSQFQGGTDRGCDSVNLFDPDTNVIAVYEKQPNGSNLFLTTCTLTDLEVEHLQATNGNFVTEEVLKRQNWKSDVTGMSPITPMDKNSSPGFTPTSSFESDVMGITPIDNSQFDNP